MLEHAREAVEMTAGRARADLDSDRMLNLALVRLVEIVGEAANRVTESTQSQHPEIPWRGIVGFRNRVVHGYDTVDFDVLWSILREDLPTLTEQLQAVLNQPE